VRDVDELVVSDAERVERVEVLGEAVLDPPHFGLERTEQFVPDYEDARVVLVEVLSVGTVVNAVMRRSVEDCFDRLR